MFSTITDQQYTAPTSAILAKFNSPSLASICLLPLTRLPEEAPFKLHEMPAVWVSEMPAVVPEGWKVGMRWMEAHFDHETDNAIWEWRTKEEEKNGVVRENDQKPDPHMTILFGHNPGAKRCKKILVETMPRSSFRFTDVMALGPPGKEDCWVAHTSDKSVNRWMNVVRNEPYLNSNHADYHADKMGWPVAGGDFGTVIPHATLFRGKPLTPTEIKSPPSLKNLATIDVRLIAVVEWVSVVIDGTKIKLAQYYPAKA